MTAPVASPARRAAAPARHPARPRSTPALAPAPLRVVGRDERSQRARRHRARRLVVLLVLFFVVTLFGVAVSHVVLAQGQFRLERLERQAAEEQTRYERLRERVAALESPERVVAAAQERLGMVPPAGVTYLSPVGVAGDHGPAPTKTEEAAPPSSWSTVKPLLEPES